MREINARGHHRASVGGRRPGTPLVTGVLTKCETDPGGQAATHVALLCDGDGRDLAVTEPTSARPLGGIGDPLETLAQSLAILTAEELGLAPMKGR